MAFEDVEGSRQDAEPIELYTFNGSFNNYYFTSYDGPDQVVGGITYRSIVIDRGSVMIGSQENSEFTIDVTVPADEQVVRDYMFAITPPKLTITLERYHRGYASDRVRLWVGDVTAFEIKERQCTFKIPSIFSFILNSTVPTINYQGPCNHFLFDQFCKVPEAAHIDTATVQNIDGRSVFLSGSRFEDGYCKSGVMKAGPESRMIMSHSGTNFTVSFPFGNLKVGDTVQISAGCDHAFSTCKSKFVNGINFGGFPTVPELNPFGRNL